MESGLTPEISLTSEELYVVRIDEVEQFVVNTRKEAVLAVDSLAANKTAQLDEIYSTVYRKEVNGGEKIIISTQRIGIIYNGSVNQKATIDFVVVKRAIIKKGRYELYSIPCEESDASPLADTEASPADAVEADSSSVDSAELDG